MRYASMDGLREYMGDEAFAAWQNAHTNAERELERCEKRILAYIIPNSPECSGQIEAFTNAVYAQIAADFQAVASMGELPEGVTSFTVNGFSATLKGSSGDVVSSGGICRDARAELLCAGLLCRGVRMC